jgi:signal transduction histidine kinase
MATAFKTNPHNGVEPGTKPAEGQAVKGDEYLSFVKLISHELGGPTAVLAGYLAMWLDGTFGELPPELRRSADICYGKVVQLRSLTNQILLAARIHDHALAATKVEVDLVRWLREVAHDIAFAVSSTGHALELDIVPRHLPVGVDRDLLRSALFNLVDNAQKFSPTGTAIIIRLRRSGKHALIEIADQGVGLPEGFTLEPFGRRDSHLGFDWPGVGLGLFIAQGVARAHGGNLDYFTASDGTIMRIELQAQSPADSDA